MGLYAIPTYLADLDTAVGSAAGLGDLDGKSVLVTGAAGLIGSTVVDVLLRARETRGIKVAVVATGRSAERLRSRFGVARDGLEVAELDVCGPVEIDAEIDCLIHAASNADPASITADPVGTVEANVCGTGALLAWARSHGCGRFLYVSSGEVYGRMGDEVPSFSEEMQGYVDPMRMRSCYPLAKRTAENLCVSFARQHGMECVSVRPCHTFGVPATRRDSRAHEQFMRAALAGESVVLRSRGTQVRSYLYAADTASALLTALVQGRPGESYNIASPGNVVSLAELAAMIAGAGGVAVEFDIPEAPPGDASPITRQVLDSGRIRSLGWEPAFSIERGVEHVLEIRKAMRREGIRHA